MSSSMSPSPAAAPCARACGDAPRRLRRRLAVRTPQRDEEGFLLLESVVAIALTTLLLAALASFFTSAVASTGSQRARQAAVQLASSQMEAIRALPASDLLEGRDAASVASQLAAAAPAVQSALAGMTAASDPTAAAGSGATAPVPTAPMTQVVGPTTYTVSTYLGTCRVRATATSPCDLSGTSVGYLRAVVVVTWPGTHCPARTCSYTTSTVISPDDDPVFALNQSPPPAPVVTNPGTQTSTLGGPVDLQLAVDDGTGVPTMTWTVISGALPAGLVLSTDGRVTGTPTGPAGQTSSVTVRVKDAFLRPADAAFSWRVVAAPTVTSPGTQTTTAGQAVNLAPPSSTCPNSPCRFAMSGAPAGLSIAAGTGAITGRPTTGGTTSNVTVTITDTAGVSASTSFTWVIAYAPLATTDPGPQKSTLGTAVSGLQLSATGGSGHTTWSVVSGLPAGLSLSATGAVTGTPTAVTTGAVAVTVRVTDTAASTTKDLSFTWTVVGRPTVGAQASVTTTVGVQKSIGVAYTCPYAACTVTLTDGVPGVGLSTSASTTGNNTTSSLPVTATSGTVYLAGTVQAAAVPSGASANLAPVLTVTDGAGATVSSTGSWRVYAAATIASPGSLTATEGKAKSVSLAYTCPYPSCTISLTGSVPGIGLSTSSSTTGNNTATSLTVSAASGTVHLAGSVQDTAVTSGTSAAYSPKVTITDAGGTPASATGSWTVFTSPTLGSLAARAVTVGGAENVALTYSCPHAPCTLSVTNPVPGVGLSKTSGGGTANATTTVTVAGGSGTVWLSGLVGPAAVPTGTSRAWASAVSITDADSVGATASATWTAYGAPAITDPGGQAVEPDQAFALQTTASCPNGGCTWTAETRPTSSSTWTSTTISTTGRLSYASIPVGTYQYRVTVTDADAVTASTTFAVTSQTFTLAVPNQSTVKPTDTSTKTVTLNLAPLAGPTAAGYTYALSGQPAWLTVNPSTGLLTATITKQHASDTSITVTVTSTASATSTVSAIFGWTLS